MTRISHLWVIKGRELQKQAYSHVRKGHPHVVLRSRTQKGYKQNVEPALEDARR